MVDKVNFAFFTSDDWGPEKLAEFYETHPIKNIKIEGGISKEQLREILDILDKSVAVTKVWWLGDKSYVFDAKQKVVKPKSDIVYHAENK